MPRKVAAIVSAVVMMPPGYFYYLVPGFELFDFAPEGGWFIAACVASALALIGVAAEIYRNPLFDFFD